MPSRSPSSASSAPYVSLSIPLHPPFFPTPTANTPKDMFTNTREAWHPPGARGIFGGVVIAQCIAAGQRTVAPTFAIHSCHCYFLLAGLNDIPITYHVERVRDGRSFATRTVQARQRGRCIFTTTMSFVKTVEGKPEVRHAAVMPGAKDGPPDGPVEGNEAIDFTGVEVTEGRVPSERRGRHWVRAKGKISSPSAHVAALGYITDWFFLGTIPRVHDMHKPADDDDDSPPSPTGVREGDPPPGKPEIGMMVSLDHSIYFHEPGKIKADEWMFVDMESPWAGNGRGVVTSRVFSREGVLLATCVQEGVVRLKDPEKPEKAKL